MLRREDIYLCFFFFSWHAWKMARLKPQRVFGFVWLWRAASWLRARSQQDNYNEYSFISFVHLRRFTRSAAIETVSSCFWFWLWVAFTIHCFYWRYYKRFALNCKLVYLLVLLDLPWNIRMSRQYMAYSRWKWRYSSMIGGLGSRQISMDKSCHILVLLHHWFACRRWMIDASYFWSCCSWLCDCEDGGCCCCCCCCRSCSVFSKAASIASSLDSRFVRLVSNAVAAFSPL